MIRAVERLSLLVVVLASSLPAPAQASGPVDLWLTPDQQGQRLVRQGRFLEAAEAFEDPDRRAAAYYRGGDFERAASLWGALSGPEAAYNRGTALVLLGRYEEAIASYDRALAQRDDWPEARQNREIARVRLERLRPPDDDAGGTGGMMAADEIRFDDSGRVDRAGTGETVDADRAMSDESMRAAWLRRVEDKPADFLRARFSYQLYLQGEVTDDAP